MQPTTPPAGITRFGVFELDARSGELRRHGQKIRLPHQSFQILLLLLSRPGDVVTREELQQALWTSETFVDFDVGLNSAVRKLREALGDSADEPQFVETLPRRGYRFISPVTAAEQRAADIPAPPSGTPADAVVAASARPTARRWIVAALVIAAVVAVGVLSDLRAGKKAVGAAAARAIDPRAYDAYLKGLTARGLQRYDGYRKAVGYFEQAIAIEPAFAEAHSALAHSQLQFLFGGPLSPREVIPRAEAAARRAIELDPALPQAHRTLGQILSLFHWKWEEADAAFRRATELSAEPHGVPGTGLARIRNGQVSEAIAEAERDRKQDPLSFAALVNAGIAYRASGHYDRAITELRRALELTPRQNRALFQLGVTYVVMGRFDDAVKELEAAVQASQVANARIDAYLGYAYAMAGRPNDARRVVLDLEARRREQYVSSFGIALIHDVLGETGLALTAIERACDERAVEFAQMPQYPAFRGAASEPRFQAVMRRVNLPAR